MEFEFDPAKSRSNLAKHKIDFEAAQELWRDPDALSLPAQEKGEARKLWIAQASGKLWTAVYAERAGKVRLISVRRARDDERNAYEG